MNIRAKDKEIFALYKSKKVIKPNVVLNWDVLRRFGFVQQIEELFADRAWANLFMIEEDLYEEMILTFLATYNISGSINDGVRNEVEFLARGEYHKMSMVEFIGAMGIYDEGYLQTPEFRALPVSWGPLHSSILWTQYGVGDYDSSHTKATMLKEVRFHILHYIMARSTTGRTDSEGVVNARDLFQLWAMRTGTRVNVGVFAAFCIQRQAEKGPKGVFLGALIMRILKNLGLFPPRAPADFIGRSLQLKEKILRDWRLQPIDAGAEEELEAEEPQQEAEPSTTVPTPELVSQLSSDVVELKANQQEMQKQIAKMEKRQKGLKKFLIDCFTKLGEKLDIRFSSCASSSDDDVIAPEPVRGRRSTEGGSSSAPPTHVEDTSHRQGKEHIVETDNSEDEDYVAETDED